LKLSEVIFIPSVQHTGTWFALNLFKRFGFGLSTAREFLDGTIARVEEPTLLQVHLPISNNLDKIIANDPFELRTYDTSAPMCMNSIIMLSKIFKTIVPIRDPLAAILTREARHPELRHFYIVDGFLQMARHLSGNSNVMFLPIDLMEHSGNRKDLLIRMLNHCEISVTEENEEIVNEVAHIWKSENDTPNNRFKKHYDEGNISKILFMLGAKEAEVEYLKNQASTILPFMASLGYTKGDLNLW
jgi:hypothetical protein